MNERIREFHEIMKHSKEDFEALTEYQLRIKQQILEIDPPGVSFKKFAGIDVAYDAEHGYAAIVIYDDEHDDIIKSHAVIEPISFPYVSTFFSFREGPIILKLFEEVNSRYDELNGKLNKIVGH